RAFASPVLLRRRLRALPDSPRTAQIVATVAAMGLLVAAAALPDDRDAAPPTLASSPVSTAHNPGRESDFGAYLGAPYHYPSDLHLKKAGVSDLTIKDIPWF